ncbi:hypothetical protein BP5796_09084 [Coleophoma crateriformis]|uniref:Uncharacterized protein n=1 Tax=Coleophoma crateriformis TaxID=565419 RepID=A0A3D8R316_9HELO|nr:hypothetical protein BP5796_09084 [Coleophoma crateriformis]
MSDLNEKSSAEPLVNVLTIEPPAATRAPVNRSHVLSTIEDVDSTHTLTPCQSSTPGASRAPSEKNHPFSPFYSHSSTRYSLEAQKSESKLNIATYSDSNDVEACITQQKSGTSNLKTFTSTKECTVWPGQKALKRKKQEMKFARQKNGLCGCMAGYSKRTRLIIKLMIAFLVVGAAIGVGLGISRAVGGGIWRSSSN